MPEGLEFILGGELKRKILSQAEKREIRGDNLKDLMSWVEKHALGCKYLEMIMNGNMEVVSAANKDVTLQLTEKGLKELQCKSG